MIKIGFSLLKKTKPDNLFLKSNFAALNLKGIGNFFKNFFINLKKKLFI